MPFPRLMQNQNEEKSVALRNTKSFGSFLGTKIRYIYIKTAKSSGSFSVDDSSFIRQKLFSPFFLRSRAWKICHPGLWIFSKYGKYQPPQFV